MTRGELDIPDEEEEFKPAEVDMAEQLVEALTGEFDASRYKDEYREALLEVIDSKVAGQPAEGARTGAEASKLTDLMAVLEASVAAARSEQDAAPAPAGGGGTDLGREGAQDPRAKPKAADPSQPPTRPSARARPRQVEPSTRKRKTA